MKINIIVAFSKNRGIGFKNKLPWYISSDLKKFRDTTVGNGNNAVIMGKNTWNSLPVKYLNKRDNLILSNNLIIDSVYTVNNNKINKEYCIKSFTDIDNLLKYCVSKQYECLWIIGGEKVYREFMENKNISINEIHVTYIDKEYECDTYFPSIDVNLYSSVEQKEHNINLQDNEKNIDCKIYDRIYRNKNYLSK